MSSMVYPASSKQPLTTRCQTIDNLTQFFMSLPLEKQVQMYQIVIELFQEQEEAERLHQESNAKNVIVNVTEQ